MAVRQGETNENKSERPGEPKPSGDGGRSTASAEGTGGHPPASEPEDTTMATRLRNEAAVEVVRSELEQAWLGLHKQLQHCERQHFQRFETFVLAMPWHSGPEQTAHAERSKAGLEAAGKEARAAADQAASSYLQVVSRHLASGPRDRRLLLAIAASLQQMALDLRVS